VYIKTITLPEETKTPEEYEKELSESGFIIGDYAKHILSKADLSQGGGKSYKLIIPTVASLGFTKPATRKEIQARVKEIGFGSELLPPSIGPELRLQMKEQKNGEWILIDMQSITDRDGDPVVFDVNRGSVEQWLYTDWDKPDREWFLDARWAFTQG